MSLVKKQLNALGVKFVDEIAGAVSFLAFAVLLAVFICRVDECFYKQ